MFKRNFTILTILLLAITTWAGPISPQRARKNAEQFLRNRNITTRGLSMTSAPVAIQQVAGQDAYYIFNTGSGFVIASGDDATAPILGYSDSGNFNASDMPPGLRTMLEGYAGEIKILRQTTRSGCIIPQFTARENRRDIQPLVKTRWNQGYPYNIECPVDNSTNRRSVTGCVATAMAQALSVWRHPDRTTAVIPGYTQSRRGQSYASLPVTNFDWANIKNRYTGRESQNSAEARAIARLMHYCGKSSRMDYASSASGAYTSTTAEALRKYFNYNSNVRYISHSYFTTDNWDHILYRELAQGSAIIYSGSNMRNEGHAFICDGYDKDGYYHINWGWGGYMDGYFKIHLLNPDGLGIGGGSYNAGGYNIYQGAVIGIRPYGIAGDDTLPEMNNPKYKTVDLSVARWDQINKSGECDITIYNHSRDNFEGSVYIYDENAYSRLSRGDKNVKPVSQKHNFAILSKRALKMRFFTGNGYNGRMKGRLYFCYVDNAKNYSGWFRGPVYFDYEVRNDSYTPLTLNVSEPGSQYPGRQLSTTMLEQVYSFTNKTNRDYRGTVRGYLYKQRSQGEDYFNPDIEDEFYIEVPAGATTRVSREYELESGTKYLLKASSRYNDGSFADFQKQVNFGVVATPVLDDVRIPVGRSLYATLYYADRSLVVPDGITAYSYDYHDGKLVIDRTYQTNEIIPARTGVLLKAKARGEYLFRRTSAQGKASTMSIMRGTSTDRRVDEEGTDHYILSTDSNGRIAFYKKNGHVNKANKAYLAIPKYLKQ